MEAKQTALFRRLQDVIVTSYNDQIYDNEKEVLAIHCVAGRRCNSYLPLSRLAFAILLQAASQVEMDQGRSVRNAKSQFQVTGSNMHPTDVVADEGILSRRRNAGVTPNGVAFAYFALVVQQQEHSLESRNFSLTEDKRIGDQISRDSVEEGYSDHFSLKNNNAAEERCLVGSLHAMGDGGGIGNVMFELVGLIAIAQEVKRIPVILDPSLLDRLNEISTYFPYIRSRFQRKEFCKNHVFVSTPLDFCCKHDERIVHRLESKSSAYSVAVHLRYLQSFKYFWNLGRAEVLRAVSGSERATFVATERLFPKNRSRRQQLNICVHARRGDFTDSTMHLPSSAEFTIAAMHFLIEKAKSEDSRSPHAYVFSDNVDWAEQNIIEPYLTTNASDVVPLVASNFIGKPPNAEWEFSRLYCDRVLLTASTSTYGWWLAFLSRGQRVYYNRRHASPGARPDEFSAADFWPQHWVPLHFSDENKVVEL
ncbi:hypothetical protein ANCCEY_14469 [Ancylostoma ceylanicum]|uniref:L-Fucosyltransferase n=1 Tax=Ancylostoma ceylanicum TaxID=53326 RepID=A0A0D6L9R9_9BILA|nr:hypothetical protein ANCCEY_14469 [Ancylostoma ceylanicum]